MNFIRKSVCISVAQVEYILPFMPYSMVRVASFGQILFFSTLERGAFLHTFLQLYTKYTLLIGSFTKKNIFLAYFQKISIIFQIMAKNS